MVVMQGAEPAQYSVSSLYTQHVMNIHDAVVTGCVKGFPAKCGFVLLLRRIHYCGSVVGKMFLLSILLQTLILERWVGTV